MPRRWVRLHASQVHVSRPFSTPRVHVTRARAAAASSAGTAPHVAQPGRAPDAGGTASAARLAATAQSPERAAALAAFLKSRTFCSDSASTTSATERKDPASA